MRIQFDSDLAFQNDAISSIVNIFNGQEIFKPTFTVYSPEYIDQQGMINDDLMGYANHLRLDNTKILQNVHQVQLNNALRLSQPDEINLNRLDFSIEMETGTGKTYVYLKTILQLYLKYGFSKHIIVVPSISIKEGVHKSLQITEAHFKEIYENMSYDFSIYNSGRLSDVRDFATNNQLKIMVINIDAFSKSFIDPTSPEKANIIHRYNDQLGYAPLDLIKSTNPIVIVDEPQTTMSTDLRKSAVNSLNPLMILRYSATHKEKINLVYKLNAVDAYTKKLVKQIEVGSVVAEGLHHQPYIKLLKVILGNGLPKAKIEIDALENRRIKRKRVTVKQNTDLEQLTNRSEYEGYIIKDIYGIEGSEYIDFTSRDDCVKLGESIGDVDDIQVKTIMISKTIEEHLDKQLRLNRLGVRVKVLSLFFIDKVANYRQYDSEGKKQDGKYAEIFEREYNKLIKRPKYQELFEESHYQDATLVHSGYFSIDKRKNKYKDTRGNSKDDESTYNLIMKDKEKLLSFESKIRFIFSHSTLREGWDNPNVFQICALKERGKSNITPRQQIGRGLRLCVDQDGKRVHGHQVNTLSVIANKSWKQFALELQREVETESGIKFGFADRDSFSNIVIKIVDGSTPVYLGPQKSRELYEYFLRLGYFNSRGKIQDLLRIHLKENKVQIPPAFNKYDNHVLPQILSRLDTIAGQYEIKNKNRKKKVHPNTKVLHSPAFKELWARVRYKTIFSVRFDSCSLVNECINHLNRKLTISRGKVHYVKSNVQFSLGGLTQDDSTTQTQTFNMNEQVESLPDIVSYLQKETHLTRKSIVKILAGISKLDYFKINPQKFIEACVDTILVQMKRHIVDGIKYQKIGENEFFSQELFENEELFGYLGKYMNDSRKSPYEYVVCDSKVESDLSKEFEQSNNISVYAKLPSWFKIDTPLGTYNPDWVVAWNQNGDEKIYFVVESKGSTSEADLRHVECAKYKCGKSHFKELGSELKLARKLSDITDTL